LIDCALIARVQVLAELLAIRLKECARKQRENHWIRLDKALKREEQAGELEK